MVFDLNKKTILIFDLLKNNPNEIFQKTDIAREIGLPYVTVWRILDSLKNNNIIKVVKKKRSSLISINLDSETTQNFWQLINSFKKNELEKKPKYNKYFRAVNEALKQINPNYLVVFGSVARNEATPESDLDTLIKSNKKINVKELAFNINSGYLVDIKLTIVNNKELEKYLKEKRVVYQDIWKEGIIFENFNEFFNDFKKIWK
ncbi:MAG: nucleotidyltransferase domain-containing protein [Candidatus Diapherotrites archaeon]